MVANAPGDFRPGGSTRTAPGISSGRIGALADAVGVSLRPLGGGACIGDSSSSSFAPSSSAAAAAASASAASASSTFCSKIFTFSRTLTNFLGFFALFVSCTWTVVDWELIEISSSMAVVEVVMVVGSGEETFDGQVPGRLGDGVRAEVFSSGVTERVSDACCCWKRVRLTTC